MRPLAEEKFLRCSCWPTLKSCSYKPKGQDKADDTEPLREQPRPSNFVPPQVVVVLQATLVLSATGMIPCATGVSRLYLWHKPVMPCYSGATDVQVMTGYDKFLKQMF